MEIERRWLVNGWPELESSSVIFMDQGYFATRPAVRVRREALEGGPCQYIVCFKGKGGLVREEIELPVTEAQYQALAGMLNGPMIQKEQRRYPLPGGLTLEVNQVDKDLDTGFFYAEVEFPDEETAQAWTPPTELTAYLSRETTGQPGESMAAYWARTRHSCE
ncbi:CYTH domain-containing protein [Flavonifractor sp. HCP28S3_F3]|uniref:CYTH domain-containing protein n=1 Tax=Flavonifractor sp. HCP28S3_F3 TaxID=3438939 RepID=UPI003F88973E